MAGPASEQRARLHERMERSLNSRLLNESQDQRAHDVRYDARQLAHTLVSLVPMSREQSLALTKLEETVMWAIKGIAQEGDTPSDG